ncbi:peptidoglycan/LPS O-acetylase OafA/YrhL [Isoptericola jiangsuensis]|uniref:Peptidoglycan/LPS O-acetylase OafA/YrhL n=1 Tax=Isoptericola jiangsuensis TaxID=548579 RepID=A0A2A9EYA4_9MICO|nr:acyltransferase [Isoptericola jiangsuensis]PFG44044.1 peptidoglycan/LPS O-acetylase OafA/YrhL [Isoptericola jiangsuensis]
MPTTRTPTTSPQTSAAPPRLHLLDLLRFGAAAAVLVYHFTATPTASHYWGQDVPTLFGGLNEVTRYGWLAVEAFFVISGFAILWSTQGRGVAQFVGSRVGRLYPALWACVLATAVLQAFWTDGRRLGWGETLANLTMAPDLFGAQLSQVVYWTLLVELKFYVLVGLLLALGPITRGRALTLALGWPAAGIALRALGYPEVAEHFVVRHAVYFGIGMVLFLLWQDSRDRAAGAGPDRRAALTTAAALGLLLALAAARVVESADAASSLQGVPVSPVVAVGVFAASVAAVWASTRPWAQVRHPRLAAAAVTAGALTYPVYLVHTQFGWAVTQWLTGLGVGTALTLAAASAVSLLLAAAIHHGVERPAHRPLRRATTAACTRLAERYRRRVAPAPASPRVTSDTHFLGADVTPTTPQVTLR